MNRRTFFRALSTVVMAPLAARSIATKMQNAHYLVEYEKWVRYARGYGMSELRIAKQFKEFYPRG